MFIFTFPYDYIILHVGGCCQALEWFAHAIR